MLADDFGTVPALGELRPKTLHEARSLGQWWYLAEHFQNARQHRNLTLAATYAGVSVGYASMLATISTAGYANPRLTIREAYHLAREARPCRAPRPEKSTSGTSSNTSTSACAKWASTSETTSYSASTSRSTWMTSEQRTITIFKNTDDGALHLRVDAPGERAVSAPVTDALGLIREIADAAGVDPATASGAPSDG